MISVGALVAVAECLGAAITSDTGVARCSCNPAATLEFASEAELEAQGYIYFIGTPVRKQTFTGEVPRVHVTDGLSLPMFGAPMETEFEALDVLAGPEFDDIRLVHDADQGACGYDFVLNRPSRVLARWSERLGAYSTGLCVQFVAIKIDGCQISPTRSWQGDGFYSGCLRAPD